MTLAKDLSDLPKAKSAQREGCAPDPSPTFLRPYFDHLTERNEAEGNRPHAIEGTRFRHSMAGNCARAIAYEALEVPASNPMDLAGIVVTSNGTMKHDEIQAVLTERVPGFEAEVACKVDDLDGSGSADARVDVPIDETAEGFTDTSVICWEHKNIGGFAFKMAVGERGPAQGPKWEHKIQGALNAVSMDADFLVITYLTWEAISVNIAKRKGFTEEGRVSAQWTFTREEFEPWAAEEAKRVTGILELLDDGQLPARRFADPQLPKGATVTDPLTGTWQVHDPDGRIVDTGSWWACGYCRWQSTCAQTQPGRSPIDTLVQIGVRGAA